MNNLEEIEVKDLKVGDEVIIGSQSDMKYLCVLRPPRLAKNQKQWLKDRGYDTYSAVKCSAKVEVEEYKYNWGTKTYTRKIYNYKLAPPKEHNTELSIDFSYRQIFRVKR